MTCSCDQCGPKTGKIMYSKFAIVQQCINRHHHDDHHDHHGHRDKKRRHHYNMIHSKKY